jgi:type VI secretion system ImpM family protein
MLGSVSKGSSWCWAAVGKHPAATDYIRLGDPSALLDALADWAAKGYDDLLCTNGSPQGIYSWRFWLRGVKKGSLICGLGRDSSDRIGRPFPLLIMGEGFVKGWEKQWVILPERLNRIWKQLEYIASHRFDDARTMEEEIHSLQQPAELVMDHVGDGGEGDNLFGTQTEVCRQQLLTGGFGMISLSNASGMDSDKLVRQAHATLAACCKEIPRGVFIGGTPQHTCIAVVGHPLATADFVRLWSV